jgi:hypothetical protein
MQLEGGNMSTTGKNVEIIEELIPLYDICIKVKPTISAVSKVTLEPQGEEIEYSVTDDGYVTMTLKKLQCHQVIVIA